jgi:hypothetical protein
MEKCKLCQIKDATKKNSHLITWALIKDCLSKKGFTERGYELTFSISSLKTPDVHIGRSILPNDIEKVLGPSFSVNDVSESIDPMSRDYILCPSCEIGIGKIESKFIELVYNKLENLSHSHLEEDKKQNKTLLLSTFETNLTILLAYSIFFRTSAVKLNNYSLKPVIQERIRLLLLEHIPNSQNNLEKDISNLSSSIFPFPILIYYLESSKEDKTGENLVLQHQSKIPYSIWANRIVFQLYQKSTHINSSVENFFGLFQIANPKEYFPLENSSNMKICIVSNEKRSKMVLTALEFMANLHMRNMKVLFNEVCKRLLNRKATEREKNIFAHHYSIFSTEEIKNKSKEPFVKAFTETLKIKE